MASTADVAAAGMAADPNKIPRRVWIISGVAMLGAVMSILDTTIVNVALATLGKDLHSSLAQIQWVVTGLHARAGGGDPGHRLGLAPFRRQACLPDLAEPVHARVAAVRPRDV